MEGQTVRAVLRQKIADSVGALPAELTFREVRLPTMPHKAHAVIGMRRAGKTYFLHQCQKIQAAKGVPRDTLVYVNFEDERLPAMEASQLGWVLDEYFLQFPHYRDRQPVSFFFDEIQLVKGWETFIRRVLDSENVSVYISGSSARMLSREVATSLRGRATETVIFPFSFREQLRHFKAPAPKDPRFVAKAQRSRMVRAFRDYLSAGGFPEVQALQPRDRLSIVSGYVDTCILRDIIERHQVANPRALRWLVRRVLGSPAGLFSLNKVYQEMRSQCIAVSKDLLYAMLGHLEDAFLIRVLEISSTSQRRRQVNPRKVYPIDPALIPVFDRSGKANLGHALESAVMIELERRGYSVSYVTTASGFEVDFLAEPPDGGKPLLIQVAASAAGPAVMERELRALHEAGAEHRNAHRLLLTLDAADMRAGKTAEAARVEVREAWEWFLEI